MCFLLRIRLIFILIVSRDLYFMGMYSCSVWVIFFVECVIIVKMVFWVLWMDYELGVGLMLNLG